MINIKLTIKTAILFFSIGTLLLLIQMRVREISTITIVGLYYVVGSVMINLILVVLLIIELIFKENKISTLKSIGILTINIPITILYYFLVIAYFI